MSTVLRIAMWSGPRNISTAMMRAWENRPDTAVWDEPLYACYLHLTGIDHPGRDAIICAGDTDWRRVIARCLGDAPQGQAVFFQKHMTHHLLDAIDRDWLGQMKNCFLIRDPREVVASYARVREHPTLDDVGVHQQATIVDHVANLTGTPPVIVDARDVLQAPREMLAALCQALGVEFDPRMLSWAPGSRPSDGVWAPYWYRSVERSTGFDPYVPRERRLSPRLADLAEACMDSYRRLHAMRLTP